MYQTDKFKNVSRELIGHVGVDSGQLIVMDPCYVESEWVSDKEANQEAIKFWGKNEEDMAKILRDKGYTVRKHNNTYMAFPRNENISELEELIEKIRDPHDLWVVTSIYTTGTYDQIGDVTLSKKQAGPIRYKMGHEGFAVAFSSGLGDGVYPVYATFADVSGWGRRIVKVEIDMITDEDLEEDEEDEDES